MKYNKSQFIKVPYELLDPSTFVWLDNCEPDTTRLVYCALQYYRPKNSNKIKISQSRIGEVIGLKHEQVLIHLARLNELGIIEIKADEFDFYGWNTYKIVIDEAKFAAISFEVAFNKGLSASQLMAYCNIKRMTNLKKKNFICYANNEMLATAFDCSKKHVNKLKNALKQKGLIEFKPYDEKITLSYEKMLYEKMLYETTTTKKAVVKICEENSNASLGENNSVVI